MRYTYCRHTIRDDDVDAVANALRSDRLTQGPLVEEFEKKFAAEHGRKHGVAVSSGTAALHCAVNAVFKGFAPCNAISVPTMTFAATANAIAMAHVGEIVFADVDEKTLLVTKESVSESFLRARSRYSFPSGIVLVDYAGQICDERDFDQFRLPVVVDACHSAGISHIGDARAYCYSFHAAKNITTGEGGMVLTDFDDVRDECLKLRNHGREQSDDEYGMDQTGLGCNYRITDFQCALGISQLRSLVGWWALRKRVAEVYDEFFAGTDVVPVAGKSLDSLPHARHLYVVSVPNRKSVRAMLADLGIGTAIHYRPVHQLAYYRKDFRYSLPVAERLAMSIMSLPMGPWMSEPDAKHVAERVLESVELSTRQG